MPQTLTQSTAQRRIKRFTDQHPHLVELACYAALPVALNVDLLHLIRINFFNQTKLPPTAEFDILISPLCQEIGDGLYEMEADIRQSLLAELTSEQLKAMAALLWQYTHKRPTWADQENLQRAQQLTALNFIKPDSAKQWLDQAEANPSSFGHSERAWFVAMRKELALVSEGDNTLNLSPPSLLPDPFAWIAIPNKDYAIAKYPLTNAQFAPFVEKGGYEERQWWTDAGWQQRQEEKWTEPRYWGDTKWNGPTQPVVGVSWYEAVAYCQWLSANSGQSIMLPTAEQWQYAAQGETGYTYPWGNEWDCTRCNNSVKPCKSNVTTPVTQYEGKGDSPFGVVDMAGNVWEWLLTDKEGNNELDRTNVRLLCGGSWYLDKADLFRVSYRNGGFPHIRYLNKGFRLALSF